MDLSFIVIQSVKCRTLREEVRDCSMTLTDGAPQEKYIKRQENANTVSGFTSTYL